MQVRLGATVLRLRDGLMAGGPPLSGPHRVFFCSRLRSQSKTYLDLAIPLHYNGSLGWPLASTNHNVNVNVNVTGLYVGDSEKNHRPAAD